MADDAQDQIPAGYTRFTAKDGTIYDLKGANLSQDEVVARVAKIRGTTAEAPDTTATMGPQVSSAPGTKTVTHSNPLAAQKTEQVPSSNITRNVPGPLEDIQNYTPGGRAEHPILSKIGDVTKKAGEWANIAGTTGLLLAGPEGEEALAGRAALPSITEGAAAKPVVSPQIPAVLPRITEAAAPPKLVPIAESSGRVDLGELGPVRRPTPIEPIGAPSPLRPKLSPSRVTLADTEVRPLPAGAPPEEQKFHELFGKEHQEARDLNEWETGSPEGLKPIAAPKPTIESVVNQATGVKPLERNVPLKDQLQPIAPGQAAEETDPIKIKYPDPEIRRFVRANGPELVDAVGNNRELLQKIHDLKNLDVREAAINAGIDVGTKHVGSKAALGPEQVGRQELLTQILRKGYKPEQIPELAKPKEKLE